MKYSYRGSCRAWRPISTMLAAALLACAGSVRTGRRQSGQIPSLSGAAEIAEPAAMLQTVQAPGAVAISSAAGPTAGTPVAGQVPPADPARANLLERVRHGLAAGHSSLGGVSTQLLGVQNNVALMEKRLLGKIMDSETAAGLFAQHQLVESDNEKSKQEIINLQAQLDGLTASLTQLQNQIADQAKKYQAAEHELAMKVISDNNGVRALSNTLASLTSKDQNTASELGSLSQDHARLQHESESPERMQVNNMRSQVELEAQRDRNVTDKEQNFTRTLLKVHEYNKGCHAKITELQKSLLGMETVLPGENGTIVAAAKQDMAAANAAEQRLISENALLKMMIEKEDVDNEKNFKQLKANRLQQYTLKQNVDKEVEELKVKVQTTLEHVMEVNGSIVENHAQRESDMASKAFVQKELGELRLKFSPVEVAAAETENAALTEQVNQTQAVMDATLAEEAKLASLAMQLKAEAKSATIASTQAEGALVRAKEASEAEMQQALTDSKVAMAEARNKLEQAEAAVKNRCGNNWDTYGADQQKKVDECNVNKQQLTVTEALKQTLEQTLQAQQNAAF